MPTLVSIQVSLPKIFGSQNADHPTDPLWTSSFAKEPVTGPVHLFREHLAGDGQADLVHHGGADKAVLAYGAQNYTLWKEEYPLLPFSNGAFGENFTIEGMSEATVCIGDTYAIGDVVVQVAQPRIPCWKVSRRWHTPDLTERVRATGRTGWYFRVIQEGDVEAGLTVELTDRPFPSLSIMLANNILNRRTEDDITFQELIACSALAPAWKNSIAPQLNRSQE